jgi:hypothetical protein
MPDNQGKNTDMHTHNVLYLLRRNCLIPSEVVNDLRQNIHKTEKTRNELSALAIELVKFYI